MSAIEYAVIELMNERGINQAELSRRSGISSSSLSRYLSGDDIPASKLKRIADVLGTSTDKLLGLDVELTEDEQELLDIYRQVEPWERELILSHAKMVLLHAKPGDRQ